MVRKAPTPPSRSPVVSVLPEDGRVLAIVVGLEDYQARQSGALPKVDFARNDAEGFADALRAIYPKDQLDLTLLVDNDATRGNIDYDLKQAIASLGKDDLFIFYYAGHGFHGGSGNRITAWDSHAHNPEGTTLLLREVLVDRLAASECRRALAFVDACASDMAALINARDVVSSLDSDELKSFLASASYCALFLSCSPGEKSYPSVEFKHGIWTHFLLKALRGEAEAALGPERYLTDSGLKDYLRREVPNYITRSTNRREQQNPEAIITASNTFAIREVPVPIAPVAATGDLRRINITPTTEFLEGKDGGRIKSLPGFKRGHFEPSAINDAATSFVRGLLAEKVDEEIQEIYEQVKDSFGLRRRQIVRVSGDGQGSLDTDFFRFSIDTRQDPSDSTAYVIVRRLEMRGKPGDRQDEIDEAFGPIFDKVVVKVDPEDLDYGELVDLFEDVEESLGGELRDEEHHERLTYIAPDGTHIKFDVQHGRISLSGGGRQLYSALLTRTQQYRFGLSGASHLLLA